jgi:L-ascorbate metabolism protein UlaG (beta-lactamase superfamily)
MATASGISFTLIGGPAALLQYGGLNLLIDPGFDDPRRYERPGVVLTKLTGPALRPDELPGIDAVLVSHAQHSDNLDVSGREFALAARVVLTTAASAQLLGGPASGLEPWQSVELTSGSGDSSISVTAVPAQHGPDGTAGKTGEVTGFWLTGSGLPAVYVSGDNAALHVVQAIAGRQGTAGIAIINAGAARLGYVDGPLTLEAAGVARAASLLGATTVRPAHYQGWAHFTEGAAELAAAFAQAGIGDRLALPGPGRRLQLSR